MRAPVLAVGDGALGFWNGLREVFPQAKEGRCWFHKTANVLAALPKSAHPGAKKALAEIWNAEDKTCARAAVKAFEAAYGAKFPKLSRRSPTMRRNCSPSTTTPQSTGSICGPPTRLSRPSPPSGTGPRSPRARARGRPGWRWRSSSSSQRKTAGAPSTHPTSWPWSAPERPSPAASSSSGPRSRPSPKLPNDLDRQVLAIVPASSPSGPGTQTSAPYVQRLSGRPAARRALRRRLRDRPAGAPPSRGTRALPSAPESPGGTSTLGMRPLLVARTSSAGSTAGSATMQVPTLAVSAEATTESGHPNLAGVECSG